MILNDKKREKDEAFEKVKDPLVKNMSEVSWLHYQEPQMKTVRVRLCSLPAIQGKENKWYGNTSGVEDVTGLSEVPLDNFIAKVDKM